MEYLSLETGNLFTIMVPLNLIIQITMDFIKLYMDEKLEKLFAVSLIVLAIVSCLGFYFLTYNKYFCFTLLS